MGLIKHSQVYRNQMNESRFYQGFTFLKLLLKLNQFFPSRHTHKILLPLFLQWEHLKHNANYLIFFFHVEFNSFLSRNGREKNFLSF